MALPERPQLAERSCVPGETKAQKHNELEKLRMFAEKVADGEAPETVHPVGRSGRRQLQKRLKEKEMRERLQALELDNTSSGSTDGGSSPA